MSTYNFFNRYNSDPEKKKIENTGRSQTLPPKQTTSAVNTKKDSNTKEKSVGSSRTLDGSASSGVVSDEALGNENRARSSRSPFRAISKRIHNVTDFFRGKKRSSLGADRGTLGKDAQDVETGRIEIFATQQETQTFELMKLLDHEKSVFGQIIRKEISHGPTDNNAEIITACQFVIRELEAEWRLKENDIHRLEEARRLLTDENDQFGMNSNNDFRNHEAQVTTAEKLKTINIGKEQLSAEANKASPSSSSVEFRSTRIDEQTGKPEDFSGKASLEELFRHNLVKEDDGLNKLAQRDDLTIQETFDSIITPRLEILEESALEEND